ncbi:hypothetical protein TNCV_3787991 [Trichonephila clavipes]|nr:hypothetical protein TNCV_3787991 [Trichonephila clavipes]
MIEYPHSVRICHPVTFRPIKTVLRRFYLDDEVEESGQTFLKNQPYSFESEDIDLLPKRCYNSQIDFL